MANIKQQKKRILVARRQRLENLRYRSAIKTYFRRLVAQVNEGDGASVASEHRTLVRLIDRAAAHRAMHPNTAARRKSRAARVVAAGPQVVETKRRKKATTSTRRPAKKA